MIRPPQMARRFAVGLMLLLALLPEAVQAQHSRTLSYGDPGDVGMSADRLDEALDIYREAVERGELVGAVILVARQGRVVVHEAIGLRDKEHDLPMERNTLFRMASNTKPLVASALAQLVEQGKIEYDDQVGEYLPEWDNNKSRMITVGQLLSHTSGLRIRSLFLSPMGPDPTLQTESARFGEVGPEAVPGETYSYNNPGFNTAAALIEIASGQLLEDYLEGAVYGPLSMDDSYNWKMGHTVDGKLDRMGPAYYQRGEDGEWAPGGTPGGPTAYPFARGSGGMISTAWDYALFAQMFLNGGSYDGIRILSEASVKIMTTPKLETSPGAGYGYGWAVAADGRFSHGGSDGTNAWLDPEREVIGLVFTQTPRGRPPIGQFIEMVNGAIEGH